MEGCNLNIFHKRLKNIRINLDLSQQEVADKLHISRSAVGKYETGAAYPDVEKLIMLAKIYGCSVDYLLGLTDKVKTVLPQELTLLDKIYEIGMMENIIANGRNLSEKESKTLSEFLQTAHIAYTLCKRLEKL